MTTIVYDHQSRKIAVDGRVSAGGTIKTDSGVKWIERDSGVWFFSGNAADRERFMDHFSLSEPQKPRFEISCSAILARGGSAFVCAITDEGEPWMYELEYNDAIGSGESWALAALDFGQSVDAAVKYAMTKDSGSGGQVTVFDVARMEFV